MFKLKLDAKQCFCCGICMDVCLPGAIALRPSGSRALGGDCLSYLLLDGPRNQEVAQQAAASFPYMACEPACDGCRLCMAECPTGALMLVSSH